MQALGGLRPEGFYTREVRERGRRIGFELVGLGGQR
jgi:nucleoside-triphosphatase THEP1